jgi:hypothetical protein
MFKTVVVLPHLEWLRLLFLTCLLTAVLECHRFSVVVVRCCWRCRRRRCWYWLVMVMVLVVLVLLMLLVLLLLVLLLVVVVALLLLLLLLLPLASFEPPPPSFEPPPSADTAQPTVVVQQFLQAWLIDETLTTFESEGDPHFATTPIVCATAISSTSRT